MNKVTIKKPIVHLCIVPGREGEEFMELARTTAHESKLGPLLGGEFVQVNMGNGDLFKETAEKILEELPNHPDEGFRELADKAIARAVDPVGAFVDYEPGQFHGRPAERERFDTCVRPGPYRPAELTLARRCIEQLRAAGDLNGKMLDCGFYNTPAGFGDRANTNAMTQLHYTAGSDFVMVNGYQTTGSILEDRDMLGAAIDLRREQLSPMGKDAPEIIAWLMPRDNSNDVPNRGHYPLEWMSESSMAGKGAAARETGVRVGLWLNAEWFKQETDVVEIKRTFDALAFGLGVV